MRTYILSNDPEAGHSLAEKLDEKGEGMPDTTYLCRPETFYNTGCLFGNRVIELSETGKILTDVIANEKTLALLCSLATIERLTAIEAAKGEGNEQTTGQKVSGN